jgi:Raf kinase inhibitor-like YbhB/YbcL family protein
MTMSLESPSFAPGNEIPLVHTGEGAGLSPPLGWSAPPREARSLALIVEDLDTHDASAPDHAFVHWVVYNIQPSETGLPLGISVGELTAGTSFGLNTRGEARYAGPCPAPGTGKHRYAFRLHALDGKVSDPHVLTATELRRQMEGRVLDIAELIGTYTKTV